MPRLRRLLTAGLTVGLVTTAPPAAAGTGPVFHDGFESPAVSRPSQRYVAGDHIGPWTVTKGHVDLSTTGRGPVSEGRQNLDLDGAVAVTIAVNPLTTYRISYALAGNPATAPRIKTGQVRVNDQTVQRFSFDTRQTSPSDRRALYVLALTSPMRLEFASTTPPAGGGPVIDDVRVDSCQAVPCPARMPSGAPATHE